MTSPIRIFFILPIVLFIIIAFIQLLVGTFLSFALWLFVAMVAFLVCWPIITKSTMKYVPVYQIFSLFIGFLILMIIFSFYDIAQFTTLTKDKVLILSAFSGTILTILILFIHGQRGNG
jgi:uncharacterized membrane protein